MLFFLTLIVFFSQVNISAALDCHKLQNSLMILMTSINLILSSSPLLKQFIKLSRVTIGIYLKLYLKRINIYQVSEIFQAYLLRNIFFYYFS